MPTTTVTQLSVGSCTDVGAVRSRNEDSILAEPLDSPEAQAHGWLAIVADGLGGHQRGDLASQLAVQTTREVFYKRSGLGRHPDGPGRLGRHPDGPEGLEVHPDRPGGSGGRPDGPEGLEGHPDSPGGSGGRPPANDTGERLRAAVEHANEVIRRTGEESAATAEMASTITAAVIDGTQLTVAQVGDSRGYLIRNARLRQITHDHSLVDELMRNGGLTPEQAAHHPNRNVITRALGTRETVQVDIFDEELHDADVVVLCSDGLYRTVDESEIARSLISEPQAAAEALVALSNQRGAPDNVSVIILRISVSSHRNESFS
jgi:serine/threonine protein phosphatase PrpC